MRKIIIIVFVLIVIIGAYFAYNYFSIQNESSRKIETNTNEDMDFKSRMRITSTSFDNQQKISDNYTCTGQNVNPPLQFFGIPENAKSLVLIMDDPDAPNGTFVHWTIFDMDPSTDLIEENSKPKSGVEGMTSFEETGYGGPCPPSGLHRYYFKLYALDTKLGLSDDADKSMIEKRMKGHVIDQAEIVGVYGE